MPKKKKRIFGTKAIKIKLKIKAPKSEKVVVRSFESILKDAVDQIEGITGKFCPADIQQLVYEALKPSKPKQKKEQKDFTPLPKKPGGLNTWLNENLPQIGPSQEIMDKYIADAVIDARKKYQVRENRTADFVDLYPSTATAQNAIEAKHLREFKTNRMKEEQQENLNIIDKEVRDA